MIAVVQDVYIADPPAAILVNWFGVEDGVDWGTIWGVRPTVGSGTNIDLSFQQIDQTTGLGSWASRGDQVQPQGLVREINCQSCRG